MTDGNKDSPGKTTSSFYEGLPGGTFLRARDGSPGRIRLCEDMQGVWASCELVKKDGTRDRRTHGWSGSLSIDRWEVIS